ncbi:hypothetical protein [Nostoc sp.]|uniref:hypothetical protein n=1 Tax=Nostoc sp. TaxID=1180 RepID=UPI002FF6A2A2
MLNLKIKIYFDENGKQRSQSLDGGRSPPISLSDAGILTTKRVWFAFFADSLKVWAK